MNLYNNQFTYHYKQKIIRFMKKNLLKSLKKYLLTVKKVN